MWPNEKQDLINIHHTDSVLYIFAVNSIAIENYIIRSVLVYILNTVIVITVE